MPGVTFWGAPNWRRQKGKTKLDHGLALTISKGDRSSVARGESLSWEIANIAHLQRFGRLAQAMQSPIRGNYAHGHFDGQTRAFGAKCDEDGSQVGHRLHPAAGYRRGSLLGLLKHLDDDGSGFPAADAKSREPPFLPGRLQSVEQRRENARAARSDRVA